jgi:hypothetical protein
MWSTAGTPEQQLADLHADTVVPAPPDDVRVLADAATLERVTPAWVRFRSRRRCPSSCARVADCRGHEFTIVDDRDTGLDNLGRTARSNAFER